MVWRISAVVWRASRRVYRAECVGTFGTAPKIRVRGATSIYGSSKPLWVVDGVIQENIIDVGPDDLSSGDATTLISSAIAGLNPDDIESFQILKDGSATSIYGAKAMAGVVVITTRHGIKDVPRLTTRVNLPLVWYLATMSLIS